MTISGFLSQVRQGAWPAAVGAVGLAMLSACDLPLGLGQPTERAVESGAADTLSAASTFAVSGTYTDQSGDVWTIGLAVARPDREDIALSDAKTKVEAILIGSAAYFTGQQFLSDHMGSDPLSRNLVKAAGNAWWKGSAGLAPRLPDLTDGAAFRSTFLGNAVTQRTDHVSIDGIDAIELSGPRADVFIRAEPPYYIVHMRMRKGVVIDGLSGADLSYGSFNRNYQITAPGDVIDFSNLSTLPPIYTVVSVDTSGCTSPCVVSALLKNLGGMTGARAPSTITFTMTDSASGNTLGSCQAQVSPDVGYNATTTVSCTIAGVSGQQANSAIVTATPDNPGHA